jgi:glycosyltransferase involved in cell wall biosynthesis
MKIGFDISQTGKFKAGCGYFAHSLIHHLAEETSDLRYLLYPTFGDQFWDPEWGTSIRRPAANMSVHPLPAATFEESQDFWGRPEPDFERRIGSPDIIHSNNYFCPRGINHTKLVYTLYDLSFVEHPGMTPENNRLGCFRGVFEASLRADAIISISEYTRTHFLRTFPHFPEERLSVIYPASRFTDNPVRPTPLKFRALEPGGFWLTVGTLEPRKNYRRLLSAYAKLKSSLGRVLPLVIVGAKGWMTDELNRAVLDFDPHNEVVMPGYVDDAELRWLYQNCFCFIYPSLFEGFGLPLVEAMGEGAPVISSNSSSLPEIVQTAGLLVDPAQEDELCHAMRKFATGEVQRDRMRELSLERAKQFSWKIAAEAVVNLYRHVLSLPRPASQT